MQNSRMDIGDGYMRTIISLHLNRDAGDGWRETRMDDDALTAKYHMIYYIIVSYPDRHISEIAPEILYYHIPRLHIPSRGSSDSNFYLQPCKHFCFSSSMFSNLVTILAFHPIGYIDSLFQPSDGATQPSGRGVYVLVHRLWGPFSFLERYLCHACGLYQTPRFALHGGVNGCRRA